MPAMNKLNPIRVELKPSRWLALLLGATHVGALLLLMTLPLPLWILGLIAALLLWSAVRTISRHAQRIGAHAVTALELFDGAQLQFRTGDGVWRRGQLLGSSTISVGIVLLNIRPDHGGILHVVIPSDGIGMDDFRHLRVRLLWGPRSAGEEADTA
jgi:hypothetical protein